MIKKSPNKKKKVKNGPANELILNKKDSMGAGLIAPINRTTVGFNLVVESVLQESPLKAGKPSDKNETALNSYKLMRPNNLVTSGLRVTDGTKDILSADAAKMR